MTDEKKTPPAAPARTRLQMRQMSAIKSLMNRKKIAEAYIETHTQKLEDKLAPYHTELQVVNRMIADFKEANPELQIDPGLTDGNGDPAGVIEDADDAE